MAFALASAGAVSTSGRDAVKTNGAVLINGWIQNPDPQHCDEKKNLNCTTTSGTPVCMSADAVPQQVFLKNAAQQCSEPLYRVIR